MSEARVASNLATIEALRERYQNCAGLEVPAEAVEAWTASEIAMFFESMGALKPATAAERDAAEADFKARLETEKEERSWRSAEREGVAIVLRKVDDEAAKRRGAALARARAWTALELAARPRGWRRRGLRSRSKSPDPAQRVSRREVADRRRRTRGRNAPPRSSDDDDSGTSSSEGRPGPTERAVDFAPPPRRPRPRAARTDVFELARRAACRSAIRAGPPHRNTPPMRATAAVLALEAAWLAKGGAIAGAAAARAARDACRETARVLVPAAPLAPPVRPAALDEHDRTLRILERRARRRARGRPGLEELEPPARVREPARAPAARPRSSPSPRRRRSRSRRRTASFDETCVEDGLGRRWADVRTPDRPPAADDEPLVALVKRPRGQPLFWDVAPTRRCGVPRAAVGAARVAADALCRRLLLAARLGHGPARLALRRGGWLPVCALEGVGRGESGSDASSDASEASLLGAVRCPTWDSDFGDDDVAPAVGLAALPRGALGNVASRLDVRDLRALGAAGRSLGARVVGDDSLWRLAARSAARRPPPYAAGFMAAAAPRVDAWGRNGGGQLGLGQSSRNRLAPATVAPPGGKAIACVGARGDVSACACDDGSAYAWGLVDGAARDRPAELLLIDDDDADDAFDEDEWLLDDGEPAGGPPPAGPPRPARRCAAARGAPVRLAVSPRADAVQVTVEYADGSRRLFGHFRRRRPMPRYDGGAPALAAAVALGGVRAVACAATAQSSLVVDRGGSVYAWAARGAAVAVAALADARRPGPAPGRAAADAVRAARGAADAALRRRALAADAALDAAPASVRRAARRAAARAVAADGLGSAVVRRRLAAVAAAAAVRAAALRSARVADAVAASAAGPLAAGAAAAAAARRPAGDRRRAVLFRGPHGRPARIAAVAAGDAFFLALGTDGTVFSLAEGDALRAPPGTAAGAAPGGTPRAVDGLRDVAWIGAGATFCAALDDDGVLHLWGRGDVLGARDAVEAPMPVWPLLKRRVVAAAVGDGHVLTMTIPRDPAATTTTPHAWFARRRGHRSGDRPPLDGACLLDDPAAPPDDPP